MCPGLLNDGRVFAPQVAVLGDRADIVIADVAAHDSIVGMASAALARAPARFALAGFSMGGYVAFEMLRQAPERVTRLALLDTSARPDTPQQTAQRQALLRMAEIGRFRGVTPRLLPRLVHARHIEDPGVSGPIFAMAADIGRDGFLRQQVAIMGRPDSRPLLAAVAVPTLVLCGRDDQLTPPVLSQEMADAIAGATPVFLDTCGHVSPLEQPEAVTAALAAWLSVEAGA
jgi:pimeloyl-ACP methyl ester carboxylesterase